MLSYDQICKCLYRICFILTSLPGWNSMWVEHWNSSQAGTDLTLSKLLYGYVLHVATQTPAVK